MVLKKKNRAIFAESGAIILTTILLFSLMLILNSRDASAAVTIGAGVVVQSNTSASGYYVVNKTVSLATSLIVNDTYASFAGLGEYTECRDVDTFEHICTGSTTCEPPQTSTVQNIRFSLPVTVVLTTSPLQIDYCSPDENRSNQEPTGQTASIGIFNVTNDAGISSYVQARYAGSLAGNWTLKLSNSTTPADYVTLTTGWQTIVQIATVASNYTWLYVDCPYVHSGPGVTLDFQSIEVA